MSDRVETVSDLIDLLSSLDGNLPVRRIYDGMVEPLRVGQFYLDEDGDGEFIASSLARLAVGF